MNQIAKPVPSMRYRQLQRMVQRLLDDFPDGLGRIPALEIQKELEAQFVRAWGFSPDRDDRALALTGISRTRSQGLDHCSGYWDSRHQRHIIVTQPYLETAEALELLTEGLALTPQASARDHPCARMGLLLSWPRHPPHPALFPGLRKNVRRPGRPFFFQRFWHPQSN